MKQPKVGEVWEVESIFSNERGNCLILITDNEMCAVIDQIGSGFADNRFGYLCGGATFIRRIKEAE